MAKSKSPLAAAQDSTKKYRSGFRLSLRYKLAFPVLIFVSIMLALLFYTTYHLVSGLILKGIEDRLKSVTNVFNETLKMPLLLGNEKDARTIMEWMGVQADVLAVRVENWQGQVIGHINPIVQFPAEVLDPNFTGMKRVSSDAFVVASQIRANDRVLGRILVLFSHLGVEHELRVIFQERLLMASVMVLLLSLLITIVTWFAIRPLFTLKKAARRILAGDLDARANVHSFDEIEDVGNAFNEMVSRLSTSLDRLRSRTEALEESEEKYRLIVENASDIIFMLTVEGELLLLNRGFSGCSREELLREGLPQILLLHSEETRRHFQQGLEDVMRHKKPVENVPVTHYLKGSKNEVFYLVSFTPVISHEGEVKLIQGVMRDITELRRIEMMKESLIRDVAHELKTPTAKFEMALTWFEKELSKFGEQSKYQDVLAILKNNTDRLMQTINSIMDLSKLESGLDSITKTELNLTDVLQQVYRDMEPLVKSKKLDFEYRPSAEPLKMNGDDHMLYRLFVNLIQNAMRYTDVGKIVIENGIEDGQIRVRIKDTGMGIEEDSLEKIFEPFVQKTAASPGIGVGLTICRDITALHQGRIWAESAGLGKGAVFHVELPLL